MSELLRFPDLAQYGVNNRVTLERWVTQYGAPAGFFLGPNTRVWYKKDWDTWLANRALEGARRAGARPPDIAKPGPCVSPQGTRQIESNKHPQNSEPEAACQVPLNGRAGA